MRKKLNIICTNCGQPFHGLTACPVFEEDSQTPISVSLRPDQWPVVLKSLELAAGLYSREGRDQAQAVIHETRIEVKRQIEGARSPEPAFRVIGSFGGQVFGAYKTLERARESAETVSISEPVDIWSPEGGSFGLGKVIAHYNQGKEI